MVSRGNSLFLPQICSRERQTDGCSLQKSAGKERQKERHEREEEGGGREGGGRGIAQVAVTETREHLLLAPHHLPAALRAVRRDPVQTRPLRGQVVVFAVRVPLDDLEAPATGAGDGLHALDQVGAVEGEGVPAVPQLPPRPAGEAAPPFTLGK